MHNYERVPLQNLAACKGGGQRMAHLPSDWLKDLTCVFCFGKKSLLAVLARNLCSARWVALWLWRCQFLFFNSGEHSTEVSAFVLLQCTDYWVLEKEVLAPATERFHSTLLPGSQIVI